MESRGSHHVRSTHAPTGGGGGREDCWSEGATETLIEAWGDRYVRLNRGHLRQKDWKEVAESVNSRENGAKSKKTDIQCKNRIDTLKKKYKVEKAKPPPSKWPFYYRLDSLIGTDAVNKKPTTVTLRVKSKPNTSFIGRSVLAENNNLLSDVDVDGDGEGDDDDDEMMVKKVHRMEDVDLSDGAACRELARAILKFGEIYERIESEKQKQMMELEKERMEFIKDVECERLNMFMVAQLEIQKLKRKNRPAGSGKKSHS
ncbi:Trihelix transcription factor [Melia azedarach]|uniref:Trihelix transcription factor n=1 Tax=Melia azedarach TaxID=155640 RepID=A0ACC1Y9Z1_MELAZ|nr:Trihelix transcription factor [Melia azedarach]